MEPAEAGNDTSRDHQRLPGIRRGLAVRGHRLRRHRELHWNVVLERVALITNPDRRLHAGAANRLCEHVEPDFRRAAGAHLDDLTSVARNLQNPRVEAPHRDDRSTGLLQLTRYNRAEECLVASSEESREGRLEDHRLVDANLALTRPEPGRL